ncbi:spermatogenesis-associated protein 17-like [Lineus longissimus]|uniref:spermatogenesis-associated protein 17-like n=1 Tax=Lineus longissimus TaxID=88925 RepID=UPI00315DEA1B
MTSLPSNVNKDDKMARMVGLLKEVDGIVNETYDRNNEAEERRENEFQAVLKVQAWWRGQTTRAYLTHLNQSATAVQRRWRGFLGRKHFRVLLKNSVFIMKLNHYNLMATLIQKVWRGYYTRKYIFNYYSRKRYLEGLVIKNEYVRRELQQFKEEQDEMEAKKKEMAELDKLEMWARKSHHLLSTEVLPGMYNSPFLMYPKDEEYLLQRARPLSHKKEKPVMEPFDPTCKSYGLPRPRTLPPLPQKPQGPFRELDDVQKQRYKPFQPTLRVATDYFSVEKAREYLKQDEWVTRFNDDVFLPFTRQKIPYEHLLHSTSKYGHLPYGTKYFRHEYLDKHISSQPFQSVVPPIPILEKLNDTYSQGQV